MRGFGHRRRVNKIVNLPSEGFSEQPTRRSDATAEDHDLVTEGGVSLLDWVSIYGRLQDRAGVMAGTVVAVACATMWTVPPLLTLLVCWVAAASTKTVLLACLGAGIVSAILVTLVFLDARAALKAHREAQRRAIARRTSRQNVVPSSGTRQRAKRARRRKKRRN